MSTIFLPYLAETTLAEALQGMHHEYSSVKSQAKGGRHMVAAFGKS